MKWKRSSFRRSSTARIFSKAFSSKAGVFHRQGVVDNQLGRDDWVHLNGIAALIGNGISQTRQIHQRGLAQNVVTDNPRRIPGKIEFTLAIDHLFQAGGQVFRLAVPDQIFSKNAGGVRQLFKGTGLDVIDGLPEYRSTRALTRPAAFCNLY